MVESPALRRVCRLVLAGGWLLFAAAAPALAQDPTTVVVSGQAAEVAARIDAWRMILDQTSTRIAAGDIDNAEYESLRRDLNRVQTEAREVGAAVASTREGARLMLLSLGSAPAVGQPPEAAAIAAERARLSERIAEVEGWAKQAALIVTRSGILLRAVADQRMTRLTEQLGKRGPMPLPPSTWAALPEQAIYAQEHIRHATEAIIAVPGWRGRLYEFAAVAAVLTLLALPVRRWLRRRYGRGLRAERPSYRERVSVMAMDAVARGLIPVALIVAVTASLLGALRDAPGAEPVSALIPSIAGGLVAFFLATGVARATLAPGHPEWRLADIAPERARPLVRRITIAAAGLTIAGVGVGLSESLFMPPELRAVIGFGAMTLIAAALWVALPDRHWVIASSGAAADRRTDWPRLRRLAGLTAALSLAAAALGYLAAAVYASKLMLAGLVVAGVLHAVRGVLCEMWRAVLERRDGLLADVRDAVAGTGRGRVYLEYAGRGVIDCALLVAAALVLLPVAGASLAEVHDAATAVLGGVEIAGVRVAPASILKAIIAFGAMIAAVRFLQRRLDRWSPGESPIDEGVRNSIHTGIGYLGWMLALLVAVSVLGLDLSTLAMIAGALSVGIGFGLQNIVSNFVAGVIMLVERPVKVGDWLVVDGVEGVVRRISVRATEVQTFQGASLIIPNSDFISKVVVNWTLMDRTTRVEIKIGVSYDADARLVHDLLLRIAAEHPQVLADPEPFVAFRDFGASALEFELRFFLADTAIIQAVRKDIRMRILETFREQGIEIPYDQRVVHMPNVEALLEALLAARGATTPVR